MSHSRGVGLLPLLKLKNSELMSNTSAQTSRPKTLRDASSRLVKLQLSTHCQRTTVAAFFRCWTRKEAYIKAIGRGLSQPLDGFDVTLAPEVPPALLRADEDDASRWSLSDIDVGSDYAAALVVEGQISKIRCWQ